MLGLQPATISEGGTAVWKNGAFVADIAGLAGGCQEAGGVTVEVESGQYRLKLE